MDGCANPPSSRDDPDRQGASGQFHLLGSRHRARSASVRGWPPDQGRRWPLPRLLRRDVPSTRGARRPSHMAGLDPPQSPLPTTPARRSKPFLQTVARAASESLAQWKGLPPRRYGLAVMVAEVPDGDIPVNVRIASCHASHERPNCKAHAHERNRLQVEACPGKRRVSAPNRLHQTVWRCRRGGNRLVHKSSKKAMPAAGTRPDTQDCAAPRSIRTP